MDEVFQLQLALRCNPCFDGCSHGYLWRAEARYANERTLVIDNVDESPPPPFYWVKQILNAGFIDL